MSWFDDLRARADESLNSVSGDIQDYLKTRITEAVVKVGEPPKGNLSAAQIAAGQTGAPTPSRAMPAAVSDYAKFLPLIAVAAVAYFAFAGKGK